MSPGETSSTQRFTITQRFNVTQRLGVLRPDSLRARILLFAVLATLLPSFITTWISYSENKRSLTARASEALLSASAQTARELDLWAKERRYDLRVFASSYEITENVELIPRQGGRKGRAWRRVSGYLDAVRERFVDYEELMILDPAGRVLASSGTPPETVALPADWQAQMRGDHLVIGTPYWNEVEKRPEMLIAVPVGTAARPFIGAIAATVDLETLAHTLRRFTPESGRVYLLKDDGALVVSSEENSAGLMSLRYPADQMRANVEALEPVEFDSVFGVHVLGSAREVPALGWMVVAELPSDAVFSQLAHLRNVTLLIVLGMLAVAGVLGYALGVFIVRPLDRLTRGAAKVAAGDFDVDLPVAASGGEVAYLTRVFNEMVARLRAGRRELELLSVTDPLTGLNNRRRMMEVLQNEVRRARRLKHTFAVLMADVDHFKQYNDAHGHQAGDDVLQRVAAVLGETTRDVDFVARYGGEEFFVLMPEFSVQNAIDLAHKIRQRLTVEELRGGAITMSFGVAEFPLHGDTGEELIGIADAALYRAKRAGRDQIAVGGEGRIRAAG